MRLWTFIQQLVSNGLFSDSVIIVLPDGTEMQPASIVSVATDGEIRIELKR